MSLSSSDTSFTDSRGPRTGPESGLSEDELEDLIAITLSLSLVSFICSLLIVVSYFKFVKLHTFAYKLITMLAVANLMLDCAYLMGEASANSWKCYLQGFMRVYFAVVEFSLITAIGLTCYQIIINRDFTMQEHTGIVCALCWLVPGAISALPFITDNYGDAGAWCSITSSDLNTFVWGTIWRFAIIYIPLWFSVVLNLCIYYWVGRAMHGHEAAMSAYRNAPTSALDEGRERSRSSGSLRFAGESMGGGGTGGGAEGGGQAELRSTSVGIINRMRLYPIALVVCWSWATVNRIHEALAPYESIFWLYVLQYTFQAMHGVLNAIIFALTPAVTREWGDQLRKWGLVGVGPTVDSTALLDPSDVVPVRESQGARVGVHETHAGRERMKAAGS